MAIHRPTPIVCSCGKTITANRKGWTGVTVPRHKCPEDAPDHIKEQADALAGWCPVRGFKLLSDYAGPGGSVRLA